MDKWKELSIGLYKNKPRFVLTMFHVSVGIFFYIGLFLAFMKDPQLNNGKLALSQLPGSLIFELSILLSILGYVYFMLFDNDKVARLVLLIQAIFSTVFHLYGALVFRVGSEGSATGGFGRILGFLLIVIMWVAYVKKNLVETLIDRYLPIKNDEPKNEEITQPIE